MRIVNVRYEYEGLLFDAAIDCDWELHAYGEKRNDITPVELYCLSHPEWDVQVIYQKNRNDQYSGHTIVDWENIITETKKWIKTMID